MQHSELKICSGKCPEKTVLNNEFNLPLTRDTQLDGNQKATWGRPRGLAVRCAHSAAGGLGSDPGRAPTHRFSGHAEAASHIQQLEGCAAMTYNYLLGLWGEKINK